MDDNELEWWDDILHSALLCVSSSATSSIYNGSPSCVEVLILSHHLTTRNELTLLYLLRFVPVFLQQGESAIQIRSFICYTAIHFLKLSPAFTDRQLMSENLRLVFKDNCWLCNWCDDSNVFFFFLTPVQLAIWLYYTSISRLTCINTHSAIGKRHNIHCWYNCESTVCVKMRKYVLWLLHCVSTRLWNCV